MSSQAQVPQAQQGPQAPAPAPQGGQDQVIQPPEALPDLPNAEQPQAEQPLAEQAEHQNQLQNNAQLSETVQALQREVDVIKGQSTSVNVETSLAHVRQLVSAPVRLRDPHLILLAIQKLADDARTTNHTRAAEFEAILRQVRPYAYLPQFGDIITRLVGSKEEAKVAATIAKITKANPANFQPFAPYPRPFRGRGGGRGRARCFRCGQTGHFQRQCNARR